MPVTVLTKANIKFIKANRLLMSGTAMAKKFKVSKGVVNKYIARNGLSIPTELLIKFRSQACIGKTTATKKEDSIIRKNHLLLPVKTMAAKIGRSQTFIKRRLKAMNLVIPPEIIEQRKKDSRIQFGNVPFNKGKKMQEYMNAEQIKKSKVGQFKTGNIPPQAKERDGIITIRHSTPEKGGQPYKFIRISLGNWHPLHKYRWEKKYGKIPPGHCIIFKDGNTLNCRLRNMKLITMAENLKRNRVAYLELPPELKRTKKLINQLNKTIYGKEQTQRS